MNHRSTVLAVLALLTVSLAARAAETGEQPLDLRLHYEKGDTYKLTTTIEETQRHDTEITKTAVVELTMTMEVLDVDKDGNVTVKMTFDRYVVMSEDQAIDFDSDNPPEDVDIFTAVKAAIVGQSFEAKLSPRNEVLEIMEAEGLRKAIVEKAGKDAAIESIRGLDVTGLQNDQGINEHLVCLLVPYPDKPVKVGDTWTRQEKQSGTVSNNTYTLESRRNGIATVRVKGDVKGGEPMHGTQEGTVKIDEASGAIVEAKLHTELGGEMTAHPVDEGGEEETIAWSVETATTLKWQKLTKE